MNHKLSLALAAALAAATPGLVLAQSEQAADSDDELAVGDLPVELDLADDDVDYEALYGVGE